MVATVAGDQELSAILDALDGMFSSNELRQMVFEGCTAPSGLEYLDRIRLFESHGYHWSERRTAMIDLTKSAEEIFRGFAPGLRKGIRQAQRSGLKVVECLTEDQYWTEFSVSFREGRMALGLALPTRAAEAATLRFGFPGSYRFFVCLDVDGDVLATLGTVRFGGVATEVMSVRTPAELSKRRHAQDLLHWEVIQEHKRAADNTFDLAGFNTRAKDPREIGIAQYKQKWGGIELVTGGYERRSRSMLSHSAVVLRSGS